jgi:adenylate cyclase
MTDRTARILVVDDHVTNRLKLSMAVKALGHETAQAENGAVALEMMRAEEFDLVLLDILMPVMNGHEVLAEMADDAALQMLPVIVVSASEEVETAIACIQLGAQDYLPKPFDPVLLKARIDSSLTRKWLNDAVRKQMEFIREILGKYVPDPVVNKVVESKGDLAPQRCTATVMMTDISGFTSIVENNEPAELFEMMNSYFRAVLDPIQRYGGIVNQFEGDAIMALFNVPIADEIHADNAVKAAIEISRATATADFAGFRLPTRIGVNTGDVIAGNVGDGVRMTYTVVGDAVNTAARLEHLNKDRGTSLIVSGSTFKLLREQHPLRPEGEVSLKGKTDLVHIWALED